MSIESKCDWWVLVLYVLPSLKVVVVTTIHQCFMIDDEWRDIPGDGTPSFKRYRSWS